MDLERGGSYAGRQRIVSGEVQAQEMGKAKVNFCHFGGMPLSFLYPPMAEIILDFTSLSQKVNPRVSVTDFTKY